MSNSLRPHEQQHARPPCPLPTPGIHPNPCPLSQWCHPTISSSVLPFSSCPQSFPASGSFQMSQLFVSGGQSIGVSASTSVLPMNTQDWSPSGCTGWISLQSKGLSRVWCWSLNSNTLATWCKEMTHLKRPWCWESLKAGGGGDDRGWDGWMAPPTQWIWVWLDSGSWWWTGRPAVLQSIGSQGGGYDWVTELNWTETSVLFKNLEWM